MKWHLSEQVASAFLKVLMIIKKIMEKEDIKTALEAVSNFGINIAGDFVLEKHVENEVANVESGGIGIQIVKSPSFKPNVIKGEQKQVKNKQKPRETMTFKSGKNVLEGHLTLLFRKLVKDGWIEGNEADFKALFSGKRDEDCVLTWSGKYGKANLVKLIMELDKAGLIVVPKGYAITPILEGHFKDNSGQWLSGLDKMNTPSTKALTVIHECIKLLKTEPRRLMDGDYQDDEDFQSIYDPYDHQDLQLHQR